MIGLSNPLPMSWLLTCTERTTKMENDNEIIHVLILNCFCCQMNKLYAVNCTSFVSTSNAGDYFWHHERILIAFLNMLKLEQKTLNYCLKVMISLLYCILRFFCQSLRHSKIRYTLNTNRIIYKYIDNKWYSISRSIQ